MNSNFGILQRDFKLKAPDRKKRSHPKLDFSRRKLPIGLGFALVNLGLLISPSIISNPVQAAEQIYVSFGPIEVSLPIAALEVYAKEGRIEPALAAYTGYLTPEQLEQLKQVLVARVDITPVAIAQFLYSPPGEIILRRVGQIIETKARQPGFYAIRAALIKAAADPEGLTLLNVLREFPTYGIRINSSRGFEVIDELSNLIQQTGGAIAAVEQQAITEASAQSPVNFSQLLDLRQPGPFSNSKQSFTLNDLRRNRTFPVDLYLPTFSSGLAPVIVISHGLGSDRQTFAYLAAHLASYGFAVAVPEHPGSNAEQVQALINGLVSEVASPQELIDRPLDIKFLLDELKRSYGGQLNLQRVGVLGQSFGGYTALALAGSEINFEQLQQDCGLENNSLNLSLLLQCRAEELLPAQYDLQDKRVTAAIAINPVGSTIFGQSQFSQINIPLMLVAGSADTVAPALPEQIQPFTWLTTPNKYLVLLEDATHFSTLAASTGSVPVPPQVIGLAPEVAQEYMKALSVAFFQTFIAGESDFQVYLSASYAQYISQSIIPLSLIQTLTPNQLTGVTAAGASQQPSWLQP
ncbi:MAG: alpha/beta hydrolase [Symplocastrum torsivum CPER-KK1]|jgi:predicted dienelactone hydrolase|uniref:Alpha/beta hydrolase n=1 Tax=Symplocastrum torsivum CPER-KK1 TaxID=450513 RepID=A0A951UC32_9CYAN|nr:alpha/beta hydrolase [Symplocastrum torsivum CPER-KK1]